MNKHTTNISLCIIAVFVCLIGSLFILPLHSATAAPDDNSIMKKTLANAISTCYNSTYIRKDIQPAGRFETEDIFERTWTGKAKGEVLILDDLGGKANCEQVFLGSSGKFRGLNAVFGKTPTTPDQLGYVQSGDNNPTHTRCMFVTYKHKSADTGQMVSFTSNQLCFGVNNDGVIDTNSYPSGGKWMDECTDPICLTASATGTVSFVVLNNEGYYGEWQAGYFNLSPREGTPWGDLYKEVEETSTRIGSDQGYNGVSLKYAERNTAGAFADYTISSYSEAAKKAFAYYTNSSDMDSQKFNNADIEYLLDKAYAKMKSEGIVTEDSKCYSGKSEALQQNTEYANYNANQQKWCPVYLNTGLANGKTYNVVSTNYKTLFAATPQRILEIITDRNRGYATSGDACKAAANMRLSEFLTAWREEDAKGDDKDQTKLDYYKEQEAKIRKMINEPGGTYKTVNGQTQCLELPTVDGAPDTPPPTVDDNDDSIAPGSTPGSTNTPDASSASSSQMDCLKNTPGLGWVVCSALNLVGNVSQGMYAEIEKEWLMITKDEVRAEEGNSVYYGWKQFRDLANIVFTILLVIVILSQITGIGLTNYGIKKILPSLIMVAILVNISFYLCQICVDLSNLLGSLLKAMFTDFMSHETADVGYSFSSAASDLLVMAGVVAGAAAAPGMLAGIGSVAMMAFMAFVTAIFAIVFFFITLAVRKVGIYMLIILSPLAIVCYALPNTKKLFDRWKKLFTGLLVVYPICGLLMGGGQFAAKITAGAAGNSFITQLVAMLLSVVPFFFIPTVLRQSLNAIGQIGTRISNAGAGIGRNLNNRIDHSATAQRIRTSGNAAGARLGERLDRSRFGRIANALPGGRMRRTIGEARRAQAFRENDAMRLKDLTTTEDIGSAAKVYTAEWQNSGDADNVDAMQEHHREALEALRARPEDREARARVMATQNILAGTEAGRLALRNNNYALSHAMQGMSGTEQSNAEEARRWAASQLVRDQGGTIIAKDKDFHNYLLGASQNEVKGDFAAGANGNFSSTFYDASKISSWNGNALAGADEHAIQTIIDNAGKLRLDAEAQKAFDVASGDALGNLNNPVSAKQFKLINQARKAMGLTEVDPGVRVNHGPGTP